MLFHWLRLLLTGGPKEPLQVISRTMAFTPVIERTLRF
jgi:hypothetical protein